MLLTVPEDALVVLVGIAGSGKTTFARAHFQPTAILSSDAFRAMVSDVESDQSASTDAFDVLYYAARKRMSRGRLTVIDATNLRRSERTVLRRLAREYTAPSVAIVLDLPLEVCQRRNVDRPGRRIAAGVLARQRSALEAALPHLQAEGFDASFVLRTPQEVDRVSVRRIRVTKPAREPAAQLDFLDGRATTD